MNSYNKLDPKHLDDRLHDMEFGQIIEHRVMRDNKFVVADMDITRVPGGWIFHQRYFSSDNEMRTLSESTCFVPDTNWVPKLGLLNYVLEIVDKSDSQNNGNIDTENLFKVLGEPQRTPAIRAFTARSITLELTTEILSQMSRHSLFELQIKKAPQGFIFDPEGVPSRN